MYASLTDAGSQGGLILSLANAKDPLQACEKCGSNLDVSGLAPASKRAVTTAAGSEPVDS
jgi:hypothetical protein